jgi:hypothetical protein
MKNSILEFKTFKKIIKLWLAMVLLFIPFQHNIFKIINSVSNELAIIINRLDELTIVLIFPLALVVFIKNIKINDRLYLILFFPLFIMTVSGFISGILNENSLMVTIHGTFDYIKFFLVILIYAVFFRELEEFQKIFRIVLIVAIFVGFVAFIEESWALISRYILGKNIMDPGTYFFSNIAAKVSNSLSPYSYESNFWRLGIYRTSSLLSHYNLLGLFSLFILTIYINIVNKINPFVCLFLLTGIVVSMSRVTYAGFVVLTGFQIFQRRTKFIALTAIPISIILLLLLISFSEIEFTEKQRKSNTMTFRAYAKEKAIEVWKDNPWWGVGPGMFGSPASIKYHSHIYEEYNFLIIYKMIHSLDQLWPQVLAEMGVIGTFTFLYLLISLLVVFIFVRKRSVFYEIRGLLTGLITFTVIFIIYTLGGNLNNVSILYPFFAFAGIGFGCASKN